MPCPYEIGAEAEANTPIDVVMVEQVSPQDVEAVKMMEHLEGRQVTVLRPAPFFWRLDSIIRILSQPNHFVSSDGEDRRVGQIDPCIVNFYTLWLAIDIIWSICSSQVTGAYGGDLIVDVIE